MDETYRSIGRGPRPSLAPTEQPTVGTDLRAVIPVASDDLGNSVRIVSIEIYDKGVALRLLATPGPAPPRLGDPPSRLVP